MIRGEADSFKQHSWKSFFSARLILHINNLCFPAICSGQSILQAVKRAAYINSACFYVGIPSDFFRTQAFEPTLFASWRGSLFQGTSLAPGLVSHGCYVCMERRASCNHALQQT